MRRYKIIDVKNKGNVIYIIVLDKKTGYIKTLKGKLKAGKITIET